MIFDFEDDWIKRNNIKLNDLFGHVVIYEKDSLNEQCDYTNRRYWCFNSLKPLPQKEDIYERIYQAYGYGNDETYQRIRQAVEDIYDEILGETNDRNI